MLKNDHVVFVDIDRAQTEQKLNLVHDRSVYFTSIDLSRSHGTFEAFLCQSLSSIRRFCAKIYLSATKEN